MFLFKGLKRKNTISQKYRYEVTGTVVLSVPNRELSMTFIRGPRQQASSFMNAPYEFKTPLVCG